MTRSDGRTASVSASRVHPDTMTNQDGTEALSATKGPDMTDHDTAVPEQPDGIEDGSYDLPEPARAAERIREFLEFYGDGRIEVTSTAYMDVAPPLYARDLEALRKLVVEREARKDAEIARLNARFAEFAQASIVRRAALTSALNLAHHDLADLEYWCMERAKELSSFGRSNQATNALWDVIDEIRRRKDKAEHEAWKTLSRPAASEVQS